MLLFALLVSSPMLGLAPTSAAAQSPDGTEKKVLIFSSYEPSSPGSTVLSDAIRVTLRKESPVHVQIYQEFLDKRIPESKYQELMVGLLKQKYEEEPLDVIFALGGPALKLLLQHRAELFPQAPIVFCYFEESEAFTQQLGPMITGVRVTPEYSKNLELALALHPQTEKVVVVAGNSQHDRFLLAEAQEAFRGYKGRAALTYLTDLTIEELRQQLATLPNNSVVIYLSFFLDRAGHSFSGPEAVSLLAPTTSAPIYGIAKTYLGTGIVGGVLLDFEAIGVHVGELGLRILGGRKPEDMVPQSVPSMATFDSRALQRWWISEQQLPPGSIVRFKEPSFWEHYKWYILAFLAVSMLEALLIGGLVINRAKRRQAEAESQRLAGLAEAQRQRLDEVISNVPGVVWVARLVPGSTAMKVQFINDYVEKLLGYSVEEWLSVPDFVKSIIYDEDREEFLRRSDAILARSEDGTLRFRWRAKDGQVLWAEAQVTPILDETGNVAGVRGVTLDITQHMRAEAALTQSEERNRDILRAIPDLMFLFTADGDYLDYHAKSESELLLPPEAFLGKNMRDVLPPELAESFFACFQRAKETSEPQIHEYMLTAQGKPSWYEARIIHTHSDQFLSIVRNVTERQQALEALRESEERFRNMADTTPFMIWVSGPDKLCTYFNKQWLDFTGRPLAEELGLGWSDGIHADDFDRCLQTYNAAFDRREPFTMEYRLRRADGEYRWVYDSGTPRLSAAGEFLGYIGSCMDITDSKRAEEEVRESQAQLAEIIGSAMDAIITVGKSQRIILFNTAAERMFACSAPAAIGQPLDRFIPEFFLDASQQPGRESGKPKIGQPYVEVPEPIYGRRADGARFPAEASRSRTELDGQTFYTIILRDITERQKAEAALRESEANYLTLFNGVNDAIFIHDKETGAVIDVNQKMCEMYGVTVEEARGLTLNALSDNEPPYTQEVALARIRKAAAGEPQVFEWRAKDKGGRVFWVKVNLRCVILGSKECVLAMVHDITLQKWAESAREEAFARANELRPPSEAEQIFPQEEFRLEHDFHEILGNSESIREVLLKIEQLVHADTTVLILGETGTGKELVANAIHRTSMRSDMPLVKVNCATLPATLIESELFGHEKGAFTSATARQLGRFELANGGTIFLDEIGDLPLELQGKLLRVLQEGEFERLGSGRTIKVNVRVIAATNRNLQMEIQKGRFREDLWYRLNVFPIFVPPLRERKEDIPLLVEAFVRKFSRELGKSVTAILPATMRALQEYSWPGNIRELINVMERAMINSAGSILHLADRFDRPLAIEIPSTRRTLEDLERQYILQILEETEWRIEGPKGAARILGLNPSTLRTRLIKLRIEKPTNHHQAKLPPEL